MTKEEREAIEYCKSIKDKDLWIRGYVYGKEMLDIVLNLIQKQQEEIEKLRYIKRNFDYVVKKETERKDKIIDTAIKEVETLRQYFSEDLQPDFIRILEILKDEKVIKK